MCAVRKELFMIYTKGLFIPDDFFSSGAPPDKVVIRAILYSARNKWFFIEDLSNLSNLGKGKVVRILTDLISVGEARSCNFVIRNRVKVAYQYWDVDEAFLLYKEQRKEENDKRKKLCDDSGLDGNRNEFEG